MFGDHAQPCLYLRAAERQLFAAGVDEHAVDGEMLEQIRQQAVDSLHNVRDVSRSTNEQSAAVEELARHIEQIAGMSRETAVVMQQNRGAVSTLQQVAAGLSQQVSRFKTD